MKRILTIWRQMTGAERAVACAATLALAVTVVAAPFALLKRPDDVSNPDAAFARKEGAGKEKQPKPAKTVNWTRYGYDVGRSKFLDSPRVRPPFRKVWKWKGDELIEFQFCFRIEQVRGDCYHPAQGFGRLRQADGGRFHQPNECRSHRRRQR